MHPSVLAAPEPAGGAYDAPPLNESATGKRDRVARVKLKMIRGGAYSYVIFDMACVIRAVSVFLSTTSCFHTDRFVNRFDVNSNTKKRTHRYCTGAQFLCRSLRLAKSSFYTTGAARVVLFSVVAVCVSVCLSTR